MALVACHECRQQISTEAIVCPHCGAPSAAVKKAKSNKNRGCLIMALGLTVLFVISISLAAYKDDNWNAAHPGMVRDAQGNAVDRAYVFDFSKAIFIRQGSPLCPNEEELAAIRSHAPNSCIVMPRDAPVTIISSSGFFDRTHQIRLLDTEHVFQGWTSQASLKN